MRSQLRYSVFTAMSEVAAMFCCRFCHNLLTMSTKVKNNWYILVHDLDPLQNVRASSWALLQLSNKFYGNGASSIFDNLLKVGQWVNSQIPISL